LYSFSLQIQLDSDVEHQTWINGKLVSVSKADVEELGEDESDQEDDDDDDVADMEDEEVRLSPF
jgi:hypothetical protein